MIVSLPGYLLYYSSVERRILSKTMESCASSGPLFHDCEPYWRLCETLGDLIHRYVLEDIFSLGAADMKHTTKILFHHGGLSG